MNGVLQSRSSGVSAHRVMLLLATACLGPGSYAAGAHIHGQGQLDIAVDDGHVELFLTAPLSDLSSGTDGSDEALAARFGATGLFSFADASCTFEESRIDVAQQEEDWWEETAAHDGDHHERTADHPDKAGHHEDEAQHAANDDDDHSGHRDLTLSWTYRCSQDPRSVRVALFDATQLETIKVQAIGASGATAATLTPDEREVELP